MYVCPVVLIAKRHAPTMSRPLELRKVLRQLHAETVAADQGSMDILRCTHTLLHACMHFLGSPLTRGVFAVEARMFLVPVSQALAPGYADIIAHPMDLSTIGRNIEAGYPSAWAYLVGLSRFFFFFFFFNTKFYHTNCRV